MPDADGDIATVATPASLADAGEAIPRLPNHLVVTHVLRSEHFDDPADLARLKAVSRAMRDAVAATGLRFKELGEEEAANLGCLSALQRLQRGGRLSCRERLCEAAASVGHLEELTALRGRLAVGPGHVLGGGFGRAPRGAAVVAHEQLSVGRGDAQGGGEGRAPRGATVGARKRLPVGRRHVHVRGSKWRTPRGAAVDARERLPVGRVDVQVRGAERALQVVILGSGERRTQILRR